MDAGADTQRVRVFSIEDRLGLDRAGPIDATVVSMDLETGERRTWQDKLVAFDDSSTGHVFWSPFRAVFEHRYRLEVRRSDGAEARVAVTMPAAVTVPPLSALVVRERVPVEIRGKVRNFVSIAVTYDVLTTPPSQPWPPGTVPPPALRFPVTIPYDGEQERIDGGWVIPVDIREDFKTVQETFIRNCLTPEVTLRRILLDLLVADEAWRPPGGSFDPDVLVEPGAFSNVENGFGFFGAGYTVSIRWIPTTGVRESAGFTITPPCSFMPEPACVLPPEPCFQVK